MKTSCCWHGMTWQTFDDIAQHLEHIHVRACQEECERKKKRSCGEANCNCKLHGEHGQNGYCRSLHGNIQLHSEDTEVGGKIIILGYGGFSNRYIHPVWKVARKTAAFQWAISSSGESWPWPLLGISVRMVVHPQMDNILHLTRSRDWMWSCM